jgi:hypothetical protein
MKHLVVLLGLAMAASAPPPAPRIAGNEWESQDEATRVAREHFLAELPTLKAVRFYYLDPSWDPDAKGKRLYSWLIFSETAPSKADVASRFAESLQVIVSHPKAGEDACFAPRHAVTLSDGDRTFDVVICFECSKYLVYDHLGRYMFTSSFTTHAEESKWDAAFKASGLKRRKETRRPH